MIKTFFDTSYYEEKPKNKKQKQKKGFGFTS